MSSCNVCGGYVECYQCMRAHDEAQRLGSDEEREAARREWDTQRSRHLPSVEAIEISRIEDEVAQGRMNAMQVFTSMRALLESSAATDGVIVGDGTGEALPPVSQQERTAAGVQEKRNG